MVDDLGFWIAPGELTIDSSTLDCRVTRVEVDVEDFGSVHPSVALYGSAEQVLAMASAAASGVSTVTVELPDAGEQPVLIGVCATETKFEDGIGAARMRRHRALQRLAELLATPSVSPSTSRPTGA
jgi:hypothetical protein